MILALISSNHGLFFECGKRYGVALLNNQNVAKTTYSPKWRVMSRNFYSTQLMRWGTVQPRDPNFFSSRSPSRCLWNFWSLVFSMHMASQCVARKFSLCSHWFLWCSQCVAHKFSLCSHWFLWCSQCVFQVVPNGITLLSFILCPKSWCSVNYMVRSKRRTINILFWEYSKVRNYFLGGGSIRKIAKKPITKNK
jgi:hypothetical protein